MTRGFRGILLAAGILAVSAGTANAQAIGSIFGKVTDASGGVLPGVTVTVSGTGLQQPLVSVTSSSGTYQFPSVPIGTYSVAFELANFKKAARPNVIVATGFNAEINQKLEIGNMTEELTVTAAAPVVDTKKTTTGATMGKEIFENIPTARDPWQIINMAPAVKAGLNVGGSSSGQQVGLQIYGTGASVQWNLEGGSITDLSSNSSPSYFNFDSFEQIQVVTGGGDVSVQSSGLSINLVTKSGSNVFKGMAVTTFQNDKMQARNVTRPMFYSGTTGFLSGNPVKDISNYSIEYGGPIKRNRLWWWAAADRQDINVGVINFFDSSLGSFCGDLVAAQRTGASALASAISFDNIDQVQKCLANDQTLIKNLLWKFNYQVNNANKIQYLFTSDNKYRNARGANANTAKEATTQQTSDMPWKLPLPMHSVTHTLIMTDRLVFNNQFTYMHGGFFLDYQDVPPQGDCLQSRYLSTANAADYLTGTRANPSCLWNIQRLSNRTTGFNSRSLTSTYQTERHTWEAKTDGTYFLTNRLGGDHSLKFGLGWRRAPIMSFSHYSGGAIAAVQCVGNNRANCGNGQFVAVGSPTGFVPFQAQLIRDTLSTTNDWWTYNGYLQDSFSRGRLRLNGGLRYDWQTSKYMGGCVPENVIAPDLLPSQCDPATDVDPVSGKKLRPFSTWAPRLSATYDLRGNGKTSIHSSYSLYFATKITLANALNGLDFVSLTWGPNQSSGACSTTAGASCWNDANRDGVVQRNELIGTPTPNVARFDTTTGRLTPVGNIVDDSAKISRTREAIAGITHELVPNVAVGIHYVYRKYDHGTTNYVIGYQPGAPGFPLSQIYTGPLTHTDPVTGAGAPYFVVCQGCSRPSGVGNITMTSLQYEVYQGVTMTVNRRFSGRWMLNGSVTIQRSPQYLPTGAFVNPTGIEFLNGHNQDTTFNKYLVKLNGTYAFNWGINFSANLNISDGNARTLTVNGPGQVYGGVNAAGAPTPITYNTLEFEPRGTTRLDSNTLLDMGVHKTFQFRGGKNRVKLMADLFNVFNINTITGFASNNRSQSTFNAPLTIVPPRVFRIGTQISF